MTHAEPDKYCPALQDEDGVTQALLEILPIGDVKPALQSIQDEDPLVEYLPAGHNPEQVEFCNPLVEPKLPAGQSEQVESPLSEYLPSPHVLHCVFDVLPNVEIVPAGHKAQTFVFEIVLDCAPRRAYLPAEQVIDPVHVDVVKPVEEPYVPAGQSVQVNSPAIAYFPNGQIVHPAALLVPDPVTVPAYPGAQIVQAEMEILPVEDPVVVIPTGQEVQEEPVNDEFP
jgi:hypothetical protein